MAQSDPNLSKAARARVEAEALAITLFESHPDFPRLQVRMRERMAEAERNSPADARYYDTVARLQYVLSRFEIRAETFWELVSDIRWQNAFMVMLDIAAGVAWAEHTGRPLEVLRPASPRADANFDAIHAKVQEWTKKGYNRLESVHRNITGRNIDRLRRECGWSFDDLAEKTGLDKKLVLGHVNEGKGAHPSTLKIYADAFAKGLDRKVTVSELKPAEPEG